MVAIFFFLAESETLIPPNNLLSEEMEALLGWLGEGRSFRPVEDACQYRDGITMAASFEWRLSIFFEDRGDREGWLRGFERGGEFRKDSKSRDFLLHKLLEKIKTPPL